MSRSKSLICIALFIGAWIVGTRIRWAWVAYAHGSMAFPISRVYQCFLEGPENPQSAACRDAVTIGGTQPLYDWNKVNQPNANGQHQPSSRTASCAAPIGRNTAPSMRLETTGRPRRYKAARKPSGSGRPHPIAATSRSTSPA
jgi:predicted carbohydrate-binding protein with CBM5 and CBM33 domain